MRAEQTVSEMVVESQARQAEALSDRTGRSFEDAFTEVLKTPGGAYSEILPTDPTATRRPPRGSRVS